MKLTNTIRDAFVRSVMNDVPQTDYTEAIRKAAVAAAEEALPPLLRKAWADKSCRDFVITNYRSFGRVGVRVPGLRNDESGKEVTFAPKHWKAIDALVAKHDAQQLARNELEKKLRGAAYSVSTRKALAEMLPEFAHYLPADEAAANRSLPVVANVVSEFVKAGWPKGKKVAQKATA